MLCQLRLHKPLQKEALPQWIVEVCMQSFVLLYVRVFCLCVRLLHDKKVPGSHEGQKRHRVLWS